MDVDHVYNMQIVSKLQRSDSTLYAVNPVSEGIVRDSIWIDRPRIINTLVSNPYNTKILYSPVGTGKTSTCSLLVKYFLEQKIRVISISFARIGNQTVDEYFETSITFSTFARMCGKCEFNGVLILDEVNVMKQRKYETTFWPIIKTLQGYDTVSIYMFSSYGRVKVGNSISTPCGLESITIENLLYFSLDELKQLNERMKQKIKCGGYSDKNLKQILKLTDGHPGYTMLFFYAFATEHPRILSEYKKLSKFLVSKFMFDKLKSFRSSMVCEYTSLNGNQIEVLRQLSQSKYVEITKDNSSVVDSLFRLGLLDIHHEFGCTFPSPVDCRIFYDCYYGLNERSRFDITDLIDFSVLLLEGMDVTLLRETYCRSVTTRNTIKVLEPAWQSEFYRRAYSLTQKGVSISPEVSEIDEVNIGKERLDYYINGQKDWLIELCITGVTENVLRFDDDGKYERLVGDYSQVVVINFTSCRGKTEDIELAKSGKMPNALGSSNILVHFLYDSSNLEYAHIITFKENSVQYRYVEF